MTSCSKCARQTTENRPLPAPDRRDALGEVSMRRHCSPTPPPPDCCRGEWAALFCLLEQQNALLTELLGLLSGLTAVCLHQNDPEN